MAGNNNIFARERDRQRDELLDVHPCTAKLLVEFGIYPTTAKARERIKKGIDQKEIAYLGHVLNLEGRREMLVARFDIPREMTQHEYEVSVAIQAARPDGARRGYQVSKYRPDAELLFGDQIVYLERERSRKSLDKVRERIRQYDGCGGNVCWLVDTQARIKNIIGSCKPPANHFFCTFKQAVESWHDRSIWQQNTQQGA